MKLLEIIFKNKMVSKIVNSPYKIINLIVLFIISFFLYFSTIFWIGSKEQFDELKNKSFFFFFLNRFILNTIFIFLMLTIFILFSRILGNDFRKGVSLKKVFLIDLFVLSIVSCILILVIH